jgi:peroxiredoxin
MNKLPIRGFAAAFSLLFLLAVSIAAQSKPIVTAENAAANASKAGAKLPAFSLKDSNGKLVASKELLKQGNVVLVFYRGSWCPFCNTYLHKLQTRLADIKAAGGVLVAVSVENPDASMAIAKKNEVEFTVLSDPNLDVARKLGIVYQLPDKTDEKYRSMGLDVAKHNAMPLPELPLAVTYVINQKGKITYAFIETDYKKRADPDVIITELKKIAKH